MKNTRADLGRASFLAALLFSALSSWAQGFGSNSDDSDINLNPLTVTAVESPLYTIDERSEIIVSFELAEGHHAYLDQFKLEIESPSYVYISEPQVSPVVDFTDPVSKKVKKGTTGVGQVKSVLQITRSNFERQPNLKTKTELPLNLFLTYQACTKTYCLFPKRIPLQMTLKYQSSGSSAARAKAQGELLPNFKDALEKNLSLAFLVVFVAGILTSFTPCIFPMIPITLAVLGAQHLPGSTGALGPSRRRGFFLSLFYVLGIAITYAVLGLIAAQTGALFGSLLGHPVVVSVIALLFVAMAFSMFGFFEVKLPDALANRLNSKLSSTGKNSQATTAFVSGLFAGIIASPCVGPVLVSILAYVAQSQNLILGFSLLFVFALGLGQIFIVLGTFSQLLQKLPRSGPWLNAVKYIFAVIMLAMAAYYVYPVLPKTWHPENKTVSRDYLRPQWLEYSEENLEKARIAGHPVIIDIKADWCVACKELEVKTFSHKEVHDLGKRFVWLEFDATQDSPELEKLKAKYQILGLPFVTFHSASGEWLKDLTVTGFEGPAPFLNRMQKALTAAPSPADRPGP